MLLPVRLLSSQAGRPGSWRRRWQGRAGLPGQPLERCMWFPCHMVCVGPEVTDLVAWCIKGIACIPLQLVLLRLQMRQVASV